MIINAINNITKIPYETTITIDKETGDEWENVNLIPFSIENIMSTLWEVV